MNHGKLLYFFYILQVTELTESIQKAMNQIIRLSSWLNEELKKLATKKIDGLVTAIGYTADYMNADLDEYYSEVKILISDNEIIDIYE